MKPGLQGWVGARLNMHVRHTQKHEEGVGVHCGPIRHWIAEYGAEPTCDTGEDDDCVCDLQEPRVRFLSEQDLMLLLTGYL